MSEKVLMFSGLEAQSEINRSLDELYGNLDRALPGRSGRTRTPRLLTSILQERKRERRQKRISRYEL